MLETLRRQIRELESDIRGLEERIRAKVARRATATYQVQAQIFLERIFMPYVDGLCNGLGLSPEDGVRHLIENEKTLDEIAYENRDAVIEFLSQPECRVIVAAATPLGVASEEWIKDRMDILLEVMGKIRPQLAKAIIDAPGGTEWFAGSLTGLRDMIFGKPRAAIT